MSISSLLLSFGGVQSRVHSVLSSLAAMATLQVLCFFVVACFMSTTAANPPPLQTNSSTTPEPDAGVFVPLQEVNNFTHRHGRAYSGDAYLDEAYDACLTSKNTLSCFKYKALRYLHKVASPASEANGLKYLSEDGFTVLGSTIRLVSLPEKTAASSREFVREHFPDTEANEADSELDRLYKFALREAERFIRGHALTVRIPVGASQSRGIQDPVLPTARLIDEDHPENAIEEDVNDESRGKKKKLAYLLPLVLFFKLKMLLVPILLAVLFIKKILILGAVLVPSLAGMVKICKPHHSHSYGWSSSGDTSGEFSTGYGHVAPYHGDYHHSRRSARWDNQGLAYRGYQQRTGSSNGDGTVTGV